MTFSWFSASPWRHCTRCDRTASRISYDGRVLEAGWPGVGVQGPAGGHVTLSKAERHQYKALERPQFTFDISSSRTHIEQRTSFSEVEPLHLWLAFHSRKDHASLIGKT